MSLAAPSWDFEAGELLLIDKPKTWTSFDIVNKVRYAVGRKKVGHAGTLDPMATGLLIVCTGKMTKQIDDYQAQEKEYTGIIHLGKTTPSYDGESEPDSETDIAGLQVDDIVGIIPQFTGMLLQKPPMFSAIKKDGVRLYQLARKGKEVEVTPREVVISELEFTKISIPEVHFRVVCSKGTYIRSLAHDIGQKLGVGAYLSELRRTRIGPFRVEDAWEVQELCREIRQQRINKESELPAGS
jgi:tRNA pseudouridine55 synthase